MNNLPNKGFKEMVIMILTTQKTVDRHSEIFHKEKENLRKYQYELRNTVTEMKNILEGKIID